MFGWMLVVFALAAFTSSGAVNTPSTVMLGQGVTVTPASGWTSAENVWNVGPNAVSLQHAGALVAFAADDYTGDNERLLEEQLASTRTQFGSFRSLPAGRASVADGLPALKVLFFGTADSRSLEGELVVATTGETGVVMMAVAPTGQMARVQGDLDEMLDSLVIPR